MTFLHLGLAIAGAACVAIPIAIHLLMRRRRKPVMWGAMRFLVEAYRRQRRRLMLEQWLLLATRCLLVLLLGLAIARPMLAGAGRAAGGRTVYLLIDNGLASTAAGADAESALARHKAAAERVLAQLVSGQGGGDGGDRAALITMGGPPEGIVVPPSGDIDAVRRLVAAVAPTDSRTDINGAVALAASAIESDGEEGGDGPRARRTIVVVLSDFLDGSAETDSALARLPEGVMLLASRPLEAGAASLENVAITGLEPLRSLVVAGGGEGSSGAVGAGEQVRVSVRRSGAAVAQPGVAAVRVRVTRPGEEPGAIGAGAAGSVGRGVIRFEPGQEEGSTVVPVTIAAGADSGATLAILEAETDADAVAADNRWRRPVEVRQALRVGVVALRRFGEMGRVDQLSPAEWLRLALRPAGPSRALEDSGAIEVHEIEPGTMDAGRLARLDALFLPRPDLLNDEMWRRVRAFADGGGLVVVTPPAEATVHVWADAMVRELGLPWTLAREATVYGRAAEGAAAAAQGARIAPPAPAAQAGGGSGGGDVLALLRPELEDLTRPVTVFRALAMQFGENGAGAAASEQLLKLEDGAVLLWAGEAGQAQTADAGTEAGAAAAAPGGRGLVVYLGAALDLSWTDLPARPLMVPLVQELVRQGVGRARGSWWGVAGRTIAVPRRTVELLKVEERAGSPETAAPSVVRVDPSGFTLEPMRHAGAWRAVDDRGGARGVVAVNADPRGGLVGAQPAENIERWLRAAAGDDVVWIDADAPAAPGATSAGGEPSALAAALAGDRHGPPISLPLLLMAAAVAVAELALARWASHAEVGEPAGAAGVGA